MFRRRAVSVIEAGKVKARPTEDLIVMVEGFDPFDRTADEEGRVATAVNELAARFPKAQAALERLYAQRWMDDWPCYAVLDAIRRAGR